MTGRDVGKRVERWRSSDQEREQHSCSDDREARPFITIFNAVSLGRTCLEVYVQFKGARTVGHSMISRFPSFVRWWLARAGDAFFPFAWRNSLDRLLFPRKQDLPYTHRGQSPATVR